VGNASRVAGALCAVVMIWAAGVSVAATPEERARARESFLKGQAHFDLNEYDEALKNFKDAYRYAPDPVLLFNIAQCHLKLGQTEEALRFYRNYLRRAPQASNRGEVEKRIAELEREAASAPKSVGPPPLTPPPATAAPVVPPAAPPREFARPAPAPPPITASSSPATPGPSPAPIPPFSASSPVEPPRLEPTPPLQLSQPVTPTPEPRGTPIYRRWWFWTGVAVVVGGGIATALAVGRRGEVGDCRMLPNCRELR
jgi:hypothetical protein